MQLTLIIRKLMEAFNDAQSTEGRGIEYIKNGNSRDVVTKLDLELHEIALEYWRQYLPRAVFISEEGEHIESAWKKLSLESSVLIVDPLDGSSNLVHGLNDIGFMAARLAKGKFEESLVLLPNEDIFISWNDRDGIFSSRRIPDVEPMHASAYLAYSPKLSGEEQETRMRIMNLLDSATSGVFRYGSACVGLYRTLIGRHSTFIGLSMRPWDVVSYFPIVAHKGARIAYSASAEDVSMVVSWNPELFERCKAELAAQYGHLVDYVSGDALGVNR